nr:PREDICTED: uncharacterized protein LOC107397590 isoform X2 [Tribolium castaneum]|eukprot:XP_015833776.1 PREDICTED: uncharacterized protein LOC107397590 isoform X2 [Tribolium castaneum]
MAKARYLQDSDDPFIFIRKLFVDYGYSRIINSYNRFIFIFHTCSLLLEGYYIIKNFSIDFFTQYGGATNLILYFLVTQFIVIIKQDFVHQIVEESKSLYWSMDFLDVNKQAQILQEMTKLKRKIYVLWMSTVIFAIMMLPVWGDYSEAHLFPQIYQTYFGNWSPIFYYFYVSTFPFAAYTGLRIAAMALYFTLIIHFQIILLNQKILQIAQERDTSQEEIAKNLRSCVCQHVTLKRFVAKVLKSIENAVPVYFCLAILCLITVLFVILNNLDTSTSNHLKARFLFAGIYGTVILYTFTEAGQLLSEINDQVFNTLMQCPWLAKTGANCLGWCQRRLQIWRLCNKPVRKTEMNSVF